VFDTKHEIVISCCIEQHRLQVIEPSKGQWCDGALIVLQRMVLEVVKGLNLEQYFRNLCANMVYLLVQPLSFSRRSRTFCVSPSADRLPLSRFADFSIRRAQNSDGLSFRGPYANRYISVNITGWAVLPVASGRGA
jgi:hypothetical protein